MTHLAAFASSPAGKAYARIEQSYGRDPAAPLEPLDDVLAHNLRAAFLHTLAPQGDETDEHAASVDRARAGGRAIREAIGG